MTKDHDTPFRAFLTKCESGEKVTMEDFRKLLEARGDLTPEQVARQLASVNEMLRAFGQPPLETS